MVTAQSAIPTKALGLQLSSHQLGIRFCAEGLWSLNRCTKSTINDELWQDTQGSRNTEEHSVVVGLSQTVIL